MNKILSERNEIEPEVKHGDFILIHASFDLKKNIFHIIFRLVPAVADLGSLPL